MGDTVIQLHVMLENHNGDPECLCGYAPSSAPSVWAACCDVTRHVAQELNKEES